MTDADARRRLRLRHPRRPCRSAAGSGHRRSRHADLALDDVRPGRRRRPQGVRVLALRQPDPRRTRDVHRVARVGAPRSRLRQRPRRRGQRAAAGPAGWAGRARQRRLRRHVPAHRPCLGTAGHAVDGDRPHRRRRPRSRLAGRHGDALAGDADEPIAHVRRHRGRRVCRPRARGTGGRRQHVRHALPAAADHPRRRHRRALGHEVPRRPQRRGRRVHRRRRRRPRRPPALHPERRRRGARPVRLLPRAARREDARRADGPSLRQRPRRRRPAHRAPRRRDRAVPGAARSPRPRRGRPTDARLRRDGELHAPRRHRGRQAGRRRHRAVHARRVAGRGREPHRAPRRDDPRLRRRLAPRGAAQPHPPVRRDRDDERSRRRSRAGACERVFERA